MHAITCQLGPPIVVGVASWQQSKKGYIHQPTSKAKPESKGTRIVFYHIFNNLHIFDLLSFSSTRYGAHMEDLVVNGLDVKPINYIAEKVCFSENVPSWRKDDIFWQISGLGFNCVRLVFALDTIFMDPVIKVGRCSVQSYLKITIFMTSDTEWLDIFDFWRLNVCLQTLTWLEWLRWSFLTKLSR